MRELNCRTDNGVRWSINGCRKILMTKLQHRYHHLPRRNDVLAAIS